jgi:SAM-dependent methyltransferase
MSDGFSADWLALREPYDHAARDDGLAERLAHWLASGAGGPAGGTGAAGDIGTVGGVLDLGCGTGSNFRYLEPRLPSVRRWCLVDHDPSLLARIPRRAGVRALRFDLSGPLAALPWRDAAVVTGSALLDLVSDDWLERLVSTAAAAAGAAGGSAAGPAFLFVLSYDGLMRWDPVLPADDLFLALFNRHQGHDKGFGPALGPHATDRLAGRLAARGYRLARASTPWRFGPADTAIQRAIAVGAVTALSEAFPEEAAPLAGWLGRRLDLMAAGRSSLVVGHEDLLALPD